MLTKDFAISGSASWTITQTLIVFIFHASWRLGELLYFLYPPIYSIGCFLTGRPLQISPPLVWGAAACWGLAIFDVTFADYDTNILLLAAAILLLAFISSRDTCSGQDINTNLKSKQNNGTG